MNKILIFGVFIGILLMQIVAIRILWNFLMPYLFGLPDVNFWHSMAIFFVLRLLRYMFSRIDK